MSVALDGGLIRLSGVCRVEDAEPLLALLQSDRQRPVDISAATHMHAAIVQVLLAFGAAVAGVSPDPFVETWLAPILGRGAAPGTPYP
jgi:hypothetical protein